MLRQRLSKIRARRRQWPLRLNRQAAGLQIDEQFSPTLCALSHVRLETDKLLLALRRRPISTSMHLAYGSMRACTAPLPLSIFVFPFALQARDNRRR
jgi:hypothetical protein